MNKNSIAEKLRKLRRSEGITQEEIAKKIGLKQSTYAMYESGKRIPSDENKRKIAAHFELTVQEIFYA